jgi:hypothetical protein
MAKPAQRKRRHFGPGDGKKRYLLTEEGDIYTLDGSIKLAILDEFPERGAVRWHAIFRRLRAKGIEMPESTSYRHTRELINAGLIAVLLPENRSRMSLWSDKLYRTDLGYEVIDVTEARRLLGRRTKGWHCQTKHKREPSQVRLTDAQFN